MKGEILSLSSAIQKNNPLETFNLFLNRLQVLLQEAGMLLNKKRNFLNEHSERRRRAKDWKKIGQRDHLESSHNDWTALVTSNDVC